MPESYRQRLEFIVEAFGIERVTKQLREIQKQTAVFRKELEVMTKNVGLQKMEKAFKGILDQNFFQTLDTDTQELTEDLRSMAEETGMPEFGGMFEDIKAKVNLQELLPSGDIQKIQDGLEGIGTKGAGGLEMFQDSANVLMKRMPKLDKTVGKSTKSMNKAMGGMGAAIAGVAIGVGILAAGFGLLFRSSSVLQGTLGAVNDIFFGFIDTILAAFMPALTPMIDLFQELSQEVLPEIIPVIQEVVGWFKDHMIPVFQEFKPELKLLLKALGLIIGVGFMVFLTAITGAIVLLLVQVRGWIAIFTWLWEKVLAPFGAWLQNTFGPIFQWLTDKIIGPFLAVPQTIMDVWGGLVSFFSGLWGLIAGGAGVGEIWDFLVKGFGGAFDMISGIWGGIVAFFQGIWDGIIGVFRGMVNPFLAFVETVVNTFINLIGSLVNWVPGLPDLAPIVLPRLESGGIVMNPTLALIGEKGPELVLPLTSPIPANLLSPVLQAAIEQAPANLVSFPMLVPAAGGFVSNPTTPLFDARPAPAPRPSLERAHEDQIRNEVIEIHTHLHLDGKEIAEVVSEHQRRTGMTTLRSVI